MNDQFEDVIASYHRCRSSEGFLDTFYEHFLGKSPAIAALFANTDFKVQKLMVRESLLEMLCFLQDLPGTREYLEKLGRRHEQMNITREMYTMWLDSLCEAVRQHDPEYVDGLADRWRQAMRPGIDVIVSV